ncbi:hypothetical protein K788_0001783 (plasmid) [Paraburkholderia caribensis MBA4]|jgi:hypothetical protein|uniref:Uncharacterized protein n=1 Tax=Paraburkholderia caribensis MBA4 TaxID=1323664 RepID=A0A0P0RQJ8_9BURK|nr:hypothetical protein K788_0001783 [Paraburkholderia caribensis MBA4]CAG9246658.1 conserved hypothetical protein [Paraburkholderia caribensis]
MKRRCNESQLEQCQLKCEGFIMLMWIANWAARHAPTPEKQAERALHELRMELFRAEQQVMDAQLRAEYFRARLLFLEDVTRQGIEAVSDQRKGQQELTQPSRPGPRLTAAQ